MQFRPAHALIFQYVLHIFMVNGGSSKKMSLATGPGHAIGCS
jgi:hypothetical protein